jgi:hypothetical protein
VPRTAGSLKYASLTARSLSAESPSECLTTLATSRSSLTRDHVGAAFTSTAGPFLFFSSSSNALNGYFGRVPVQSCNSVPACCSKRWNTPAANKFKTVWCIDVIVS